MSTTDVSPGEERWLKSLIKGGWDLLNKHPEVKNKLINTIFSSSRDISPDEERELSAMAEELKGDAMQRSRDLSSGNVSQEDQERWLAAVVGAATTGYQIYKDNPGAVKKVKSFLSKLW